MIIMAFINFVFTIFTFLLLFKLIVSKLSNSEFINVQVPTTNNLQQPLLPPVIRNQEFPILTPNNNNNNNENDDSTTNSMPSTSDLNGINEMLVPKNSTTALICEPIFNENSADKTAIWYKDGKQIAVVTGHSNAIYDNRQIEFEGPIPKVGFLIITKIQIEDQGDYWCAREDNGMLGERSRLKVAFLNTIDSTHQQPHVHFTTNNGERSGDFINGQFIGRPFLGETIRVDCPRAKALPKPAISWLFEGESVDFSENRLEVHRNGSLVIRRFSPTDSGTYECILTNLAGRFSAKIFIGLPILPANGNTMSTKSDKSSNFALTIPCINYFRNEILWFLIGCLTTSCIVLLYMISGLIFYKCSKRGRRQRFGFLPYVNERWNLDNAADRQRNPTSFWRFFICIDPNIVPGFRKVVAPVTSLPPRLRDGRSANLPNPTNQLIRQNSGDDSSDESITANSNQNAGINISI